MDYVYTASSLPKGLCEKIIENYEKELVLKYQGVTGGGLDKNIKDTQDMIIPENEVWEEVNDILSFELQKHVKEYIEKIEKGENYKEENNFGVNYKHLSKELIQEDEFMIQRYEKKKGKYIYHEDSSNTDKKSRVITYLWYLNDVVEGGETEFFGGSSKIKPETGKLLLFPAVWCYPHRGNIPISSNKYIITGWLYQEHMNIENITPVISLNQSVIIENKDKEEKALIFDYFHKENKTLFIDYKSRLNGISIFNPLEIITYTPLLSQWILSNLPDKEINDVETLSDKRSFIISSFAILVETIKKSYFINCNFNIKKWVILNNGDYKFDIHYDLCIQTDLSSGISYVGQKYKKIDNPQLVYLIEYTFHYLDGTHDRKNLTLKEIVEPCIGSI